MRSTREKNGCPEFGLVRRGDDPCRLVSFAALYTRVVMGTMCAALTAIFPSPTRFFFQKRLNPTLGGGGGGEDQRESTATGREKRGETACIEEKKKRGERFTISGP